MGKWAGGRPQPSALLPAALAEPAAERGRPQVLRPLTPRSPRAESDGTSEHCQHSARGGEASCREQRAGGGAGLLFRRQGPEDAASEAASPAFFEARRGGEVRLWKSEARAPRGEEERGCSPEGAEDVRLRRIESMMESHLYWLEGPGVGERLARMERLVQGLRAGLEDDVRRGVQAARAECGADFKAALDRHTAAVLGSLGVGSTPVSRFPTEVTSPCSSHGGGSPGLPPATAAAAAAAAAALDGSGAAGADAGRADHVALTVEIPDQPAHQDPLRGHTSWTGSLSSGSSELDLGKMLHFRQSEREETKREPSRWSSRSTVMVKAGAVTHAVRAVRHRIDTWRSHVEECGPGHSPQGHSRCTRYFFRHLSKPFDFLCMVVILANVGFVVYSTNLEMASPTESQDAYITAVNYGFATFYILELVVRMVTQRVFFFFGHQKYWHLFDLTLIATSLTVETNIEFLRAFRVLRAAKIIRFYRLLGILGLGRLESMVTCLTGSFGILFWCIVMVGFFTFLFAVFFVQGIALHIGSQGDLDAAVEAEFYRWFGSVQEGMISLLMITTGGADWKEVYVVVRETGWVAAASLVLYILLFTIAVWNVVTSTFVDHALKLAKPSDEAIVSEARRQAQEDARELRATFRKMDLDCNGELDAAEFAACMSRPEFDRFLQARGLDIKETKVFFKMVAHNKTSVNINHIVNSCMRVRGYATSIDLHTMRYELRRMQAAMLRQVCSLCHQANKDMPRATRPSSGTDAPSLAALDDGDPLRLCAL